MVTTSQPVHSEDLGLNYQNATENFAISIGISLTTAKRATAKLKKMGINYRIGNNRSGNWEVIQNRLVELNNGDLAPAITDKRPKGQLTRVITLDTSPNDTNNDTNNDTKK